MAEDITGSGGWPNLTNTGVTFQSLITQLASNNQQLSALFQLLTAAITNVGLIQFVPPPSVSSSAGVAGQISYDATHFYLCVGPAEWIRFTGTTF